MHLFMCESLSNKNENKLNKDNRNRHSYKYRFSHMGRVEAYLCVILNKS